MRVLIAEDEFLVGIQLEEDLRSAGCSIVGPFSTLESATQASRRERFDLAVLDINLDMVYPLADELSARGVPFIFLSGYVLADLPARFKRSPQLTKPHDPIALNKEVPMVVSSRRADARCGKLAGVANKRRLGWARPLLSRGGRGRRQLALT